jgi:L,D-transpeptidase catalytic domain
MKVRVGTGVGSVTLLLAAAAACAPAGAQAAGCAAPKPAVVTTTTTTTTPTVTTTTTTGTTTTGTPTTGITTTPTTTVKTTTTTKRKPVKAVRATSTTLSLAGLFTVGKTKAKVTVPHRSVEISGRIRPYVMGQRFLVSESVGGRRFKTVKLAARCLAGTNTGSFELKVAAPRAGEVTVKLRHATTKTMKAFKLQGSFDSLNPNVGLGATGVFVELLQQQLAALHLFIPQTGKFDLGTELALDAYHRLLGEGEGIETLGPKTVTALLNGDGSFHVRFAKQGNHAEGDLSDQLLAFIDDGTKVQWIFPISSGKPSTPTILGNFQIYYKEPEYTSDGMYFSSFFHGGYAIHGYNPAPDYPASHGCMRLPMVDAIPAYGWTRVGDWVDTYYT